MLIKFIRLVGSLFNIPREEQRYVETLLNKKFNKEVIYNYRRL